MKSFGISCCVLSLAVIPLAEAGTTAAVQHTTTRVIDVRRSAPADLSLATVTIRGVVTAFSGWNNSFFLQDATGGISVDRQEQTAVQIGQELEVTGTVKPGFFAPVILSSHIEVLGNQRRPPPLHPAYEGLARGQLDSQWVEVSGVVHAARIGVIWGRSVLTLDLHMASGSLAVQVHDFAGRSGDDLVDSVVRIRGVCGTIFNDRRQLVGLRLFVPGLDDIRVDSPAVPVGRLPLSPLGSLLAFSPNSDPERRVRIAGVVTYQNPGRMLYLQDQGVGVLVRTRQSGNFPVGTRAEAAGFVSPGGYSPELTDAIVRATGSGPPPAPIPISAASVIKNQNGFLFAPANGLLVQIHADIVDRPPPAQNQTWLLRDGSVVFQAEMNRPLNGRLGMGRGNEVNLTGVLAVESGEGRNPESFRILVRSPQDFSVISTPYWRISRLFLMTAFFLIAGLALFAWAFQTQLSLSGAPAPDLPSPVLVVGFARASKIMAVIAGTIAIANLIGWAFGIEELKSVVAGYVSMMPSTAVAFLFAATYFSFAPDSGRWRSVVQRLCGLTVTAIGVSTLLEYVTGRGSSIDQLLIVRNADLYALDGPPRMAFVSAFGFLFLGSALLVNRKRSVLPAQWLAIGSGVFSILNLVGYLYGLQDTEVGAYKFMAVHTALCFLLLSLALLFRTADSSVMAALSSAALGGVMGRRLIPAALLLPAIIGWIRWQGELSGLYGAVFGLALSVSANMAVFALLIWTSAVLLNRLDAAQSQTERELRLLVDGTKDYAIFMLDRNGKIANWNGGAERINGYSAQEAIGRPLSFLYEAEEASLEQAQKQAGEALRIAIAEGRYEEESWHIRRDGARFWAHVVITALKDKGGNLRGFSNVTRDATELKKANGELVSACQRAEEANRAKSDFLATMSHEIRTPMNAILGMTDLVMETGLNPIQREYVDRCRRAGANLLNLINDILDLSKIESSRFELEQIPFNVADLVGRTIDLIAPKAQSKGLVVSTQVTPETPGVLIGDPYRLQQLLINLLGNAVKFTQRGQILLNIAPHADGKQGHLLFEVIDSGIGIPEEKLGKIFDDFVQAESSTTRRFGGSGLGLGIARRLANRMGGELTVASNQGVGSTFRFDAHFSVSRELLPNELPAPTHKSESVKWMGEASGGVSKILVAEDSEDNRFLLEAYLMDQPYEMTFVENGEDAVHAFQKESFGLVLMDVQMPVMDGLEATKLIREFERENNRSRTPILALTANAFPSDRELSHAAGCDGHLSKPISKETLVSAVKASVLSQVPAVY